MESPPRLSETPSQTPRIATRFMSQYLRRGHDPPKKAAKRPQSVSCRSNTVTFFPTTTAHTQGETASVRGPRGVHVATARLADPAGRVGHRRPAGGVREHEHPRVAARASAAVEHEPPAVGHHEAAPVRAHAARDAEHHSAASAAAEH